MSHPFVSVLTPTYNRRKFIPTTIACFKAQDYPKDRMEWIILDDGTDKVGDLFAASGLTNVRYVEMPEGTKLPIGAKRNRMNEMAKGEIVVCWDDGDYYPPERVKKAVYKLRSVPGRKVEVVGSSLLYLYFTDRDEIWTIGPYAQNHCTNGTMAYWRSYFGPNRYDDTAEKSEERKFMQDWKTPVLQLKSEETMLVICHAHNTYDKRKMFEQKNPLLKKLTIKLKYLVRDKACREFYTELAKDYKELDAQASVEPAAEPAAEPPAEPPAEPAAEPPAESDSSVADSSESAGSKINRPAF
jgi:glycosyltransferase involved in cell wall biosynthesis